jgi:arsenite methyltransferase
MVKKGLQNVKKTIRKNYGKIALQEGTTCCSPGCCSSTSPNKAASAVGYDTNELGSVPAASVLGVGCGAPGNFAELQSGETVVDLGSGAGIDVFLSANKVGGSGRVIGIDMTNEMLERANRCAKSGGYANVEFRKGDIEKRIPVDKDSTDVVISNCVINLTTDKVKAFKEIRRILKDGGRMVISDLVTDRKAESIDPERWSDCIDGALTKSDYLSSITKAGFKDASVLEERRFMGGEPVNDRKITSIVVRAVKQQ